MGSKFFTKNINIRGTSVPANNFNLSKNAEILLNTLVKNPKDNIEHNFVATPKITIRKKRPKVKTKKHINFKFKQLLISHNLFHLRRKRRKKTFIHTLFPINLFKKRFTKSTRLLKLKARKQKYFDKSKKLSIKKKQNLHSYTQKSRQIKLKNTILFLKKPGPRPRKKPFLDFVKRLKYLKHKQFSRTQKNRYQSYEGFRLAKSVSSLNTFLNPTLIKKKNTKRTIQTNIP